MVNQWILLAAVSTLAGCYTRDDGANDLQESDARITEEDTKVEPTDAEPSAKLDQQVYAFLYAQQSLHSSEDYLLPSEFDAMAYVQALLDVKNNLKSDKQDESLQDLIKVAVSAEVLRAVVDLILDGADTDADSKLDYNEFMNYRIGSWNPTPELDDNINTWRQAAFPIVAGLDAKIDKDELLALLVMQRKYVQSLRTDSEAFQKLVKVTRDQFIHNFDSDGDGKLNMDELDDLRTAALEERDRYLSKVAELCVDEENADMPICRIDSYLADACEKAKEGSIIAKFCTLVLAK